MNKPFANHPLVGTRAIYHEKLPPYDPAADTEPGTLIVANGMEVEIKAVFRYWNDVDGLDMMTVFVPATGYTTHVPPRALGYGRLNEDGSVEPFAFVAEEHALSDCAWWDRPDKGPDCSGRMCQVGDGMYSVLCETHYNKPC